MAHSPRVIARARLALSPFRIPRRRDLAELTAISATVLRKPGTCREIMIIHRPHQRLGTEYGAVCCEQVIRISLDTFYPLTKLVECSSLHDSRLQLTHCGFLKERTLQEEGDDIL